MFGNDVCWVQVGLYMLPSNTGGRDLDLSKLSGTPGYNW